MKFFSAVLLSSAIALSTPLSAMAQTQTMVGQLDNVSGSVLVERNGEFFRTNSDSNVTIGDRIIAIDGASADITFGGCDISVTDTSSVAITSAQDCAGKFTVTPLEIGDPARQVSVASLEIEGESGILIALLAAAAVIAGIILIVDDDDTPVSP